MGAVLDLERCNDVDLCSAHGEWDPTGRPVPAAAFVSLFDGFDKDGSGEIDFAEWMEAFGEIDADGSGNISRQEWYNKFQQTMMFDIIDLDKSGMVTRQEWIRAFSIFDKDGDGTITQTEWEAANLRVANKAKGMNGRKSKGLASAWKTPPSTPGRGAMMRSNLRPCPALHVLKAQMKEGFERACESRGAMRLLHAVSQADLASAQIALAQCPQQEWIHTCDQLGDSALHLACRLGDIHFTGLLLRSKAELGHRNLKGEVPLHKASFGGFAEIVDLLCRYDADPLIADLNGEMPGLIAVERHAVWNSGGIPGEPPTRQYQTPIARSWKEPSGGVPTAKLHRHRRTEVIKYILDQMDREDPNSPSASNLVAASGVTGLHMSTSKSDMIISKLLLARKARVDAIEHLDHATPLMYTLKAGAPLSMVKLLINNRADANMQDGHGRTCLHYACGAGDASVGHVAFLLRHRCAPETEDRHGETALSVALVKDHPEIARCLLAAGARPHGCRAQVQEMRESGSRNKVRSILEAVL
mmetsp:Transcript_10291/g.30548  ORF Transcript_10291/g.30548 Transcript_10291/m.30548 type:complete len:529 (+) Transcript_10291:133-1719(+)